MFYTFFMAPARNQDDTSPPHWPPALPGLILENLREYAVFATDLAGVVVGCNPGVESVLGYRPADFIGRDARCLFTEEERAAHVPEQEMATARKQGRAADERWHVKANGKHFFAYGVMSALEGETGELLGYAKIVRDATDTHVQREHLESSEALFRSTVQQAPIPMIVHTAQGEVVHLSRAFTEITGYRKEDLPDSTSWLRKGLRVGEEALPIWQEELEQRNTPPPEELTVYTATGETRSWRLYTSEALRVEDETYFVMAALDLTERKRAEDAQQESEARYRTLFNATDEGFCVIDMIFEGDQPADFRYIETNPQFESQSGLTGVEGKTALEFVTTLERRWLELFAQVALSGESVRYEERVAELGRWFDGYAFRIGGEGSRRVGVLFKDITERKRTEEALATLNRELEKRVESRTEQVQALSRQLTLAEAQERSRLAQVLHDGLQQHLYAVQFALRDIRLAVGDAPEVAAQLDKTSTFVKEAVQLARTTTTDLSPPVLAGEGLVEALRWLDTDMQRRYGLSVNVNAADALTVLDEAVRVLLFSLVRELLFNVVKHAGVTGATVTLAEAEGQLSIAVRDGGRGFDPTMLEGAATGLGLSGIRKRLELFGGRLEVNATPGEGTQVTIILPTSALRVD